MWKSAGFLKAEVDVENAMRRLSFYIENIPPRYKVFYAHELLEKPAPDKWSRQEILGHLIDSAVNNLKRFTEIQFLPQPYIIQSYNQDELVKVNNYQNLSLDHLLNLWQAVNRQIVYAVRNIPADKLDYPVNPQYDNKKMQTLGWIICDYVAHLEHHLEQVWREKT